MDFNGLMLEVMEWQKTKQQVPNRSIPDVLKATSSQKSLCYYHILIWSPSYY